MKRQTGFTLVEVVVVVLVIGLIGFIGLRVWGTYSSQEVAKQNTDTTPSKITTVADLETTEKQLDNIDVAGSFESDLDSQVDF